MELSHPGCNPLLALPLVNFNPTVRLCQNLDLSLFPAWVTDIDL